MATLGFIARRTGHGLRQFLGSVILTSLTIAMTLGVFGGFLMLQLNLEKLLRGLGDRMQVTAYLAPGLDGAELQALLARLHGFPAIDQVRYTSQEQAWRDFQASLGAQSALLEGLPRDVLPASVEISVRPTFRDSAAMEHLAGLLKQQKELTQIDYPQQWVERLSLVALALQWAKWFVAGVLFLATFFLVSNMVKLAVMARREEIEVMQLVGASEALIQAPLAVEGLVQGLVGASGGLALLWGVYRALRNDVAGLSEIVPGLGTIEFLDAPRIALILAIGVALGASASLFAARGMVRSWHASAR